MSKKKRRQYTTEFKAEAVKLVLEEGLSATQAAKDLGITQSVLSRWVTKAREVARPGALSEQERAELGRLRRENSILRKERAILKKLRPFWRRRCRESLPVHPSGEGHLVGPADVSCTRGRPVGLLRLARVRSEYPSTRATDDLALAVHIKAVHRRNRGTYGSPPVLAKLRAEGLVVGRHRVARIMHEHDVSGTPKRRFKGSTTDSDHADPIAPNLLKRGFTADRPNAVWVGDITCCSPA